MNGNGLYFLVGNAVRSSVSGGNGQGLQDTPGLTCLNVFGEMTTVLSKNMYMQISGIPFLVSLIFFPCPIVASRDGLWPCLGVVYLNFFLDSRKMVAYNGCPSPLPPKKVWNCALLF